MANNEEFFCNVCGRERTFYLESDMCWYCDECGSVLGANSNLKDDDELELALEEFEDEHGQAVYCGSCNNFVVVKDILEDGMCTVCGNELDTELSEKGYTYCEDTESYVKKIEED